MKLMPLAEVSAFTPLKDGKLLDTPKPSAASAVTLRPFVANWVTCWPVIRAVSYTHLDVYKRQIRP